MGVNLSAVVVVSLFPAIRFLPCNLLWSIVFFSQQPTYFFCLAWYGSSGCDWLVPGPFFYNTTGLRASDRAERATATGSVRPARWTCEPCRSCAAPWPVYLTRSRRSRCLWSTTSTGRRVGLFIELLSHRSMRKEKLTVDKGRDSFVFWLLTWCEWRLVVLVRHSVTVSTQPKLAVLVDVDRVSIVICFVGYGVST